ATPWIAPNSPNPGGYAGSRSAAARATFGAISLSSSSHFTLMPNSNSVNPVALPPGRAKLATKPAPTGSGGLCEYDRHGAGRLMQRRHRCAASGQDDIGRERDQFRRMFANALHIAPGPAGIDLHSAAIGPAQLLQALLERRDAGFASGS